MESRHDATPLIERPMSNASTLSASAPGRCKMRRLHRRSRHEPTSSTASELHVERPPANPATNNAAAVASACAKTPDTKHAMTCAAKMPRSARFSRVRNACTNESRADPRTNRREKHKQYGDGVVNASKESFDSHEHHQRIRTARNKKDRRAGEPALLIITSFGCRSRKMRALGCVSLTLRCPNCASSHHHHTIIKQPARARARSIRSLGAP